MSRLCLDTSAYSQFKRGHPGVTELIDKAEWIGFPSVALGELWLGFLKGQKLEENVEALEVFLSHPVVERLDVDFETARIYGELVLELHKAGRPIPTNDIWIAALGVRSGSVVLSFDGHFGWMNRVSSRVLSATD